MLWKLALVAALVAGAYAILQRDRIENELKEGIAVACKKMNVVDKVLEDAQQAVSVFRWCLERLVDVDTVLTDIRDAETNDDMDVVFKKHVTRYCNSTGQLQACIDAFKDGVEPCVPDAFRSLITVFTNGSINMLDFFCFNDGDRVALFFAEGGPGCYVESLPEMQKCYAAEIQMSNLVNLNLDQRCKLYDQWAACIVKAFEKCRSQTPSNMVDSMFKTVRKQTTCLPLKPTEGKVAQRSRFNWHLKLTLGTMRSG